MLTGRLSRHIATLSTVQLMTYAVPLLTVPYLSRVLGPERFGLLAFAQAFVVYFDVITDYGFNLSATRRIAIHRDNPAEVSRIFWSTLIAKLALMVLSGLVLALLLIFVPALRREAALYCAAFLTVVGTAIFPAWLFQGLERMSTLAAGFSAARLLSVPLILIFVKTPEDYVRAAAVQGAVGIVAAILTAHVLWTSIKIQPLWPAFGEVVQTLLHGRHLFLSNTAMYLLSPTSVFLLGIVSGPVEVGYYSAADKLIKAASSLWNPVTQALYPHLNSLLESSRQSTLRLIRRSLAWTSGIGLAATIATVVLASPVVHALLGSRFEPSVRILELMAPLQLLSGINCVLGTQTMLVFRLDSIVSRICLYALIVNAGLTLLFATIWGSQGAAVAAVLSSLVMSLLMAAAARKADLAIWKQSHEVVCTP